MSISGVVLGLINIAIVVVLLLLIGAVAVWILPWKPPDDVRKLYIGFVALVALYMIAALILGWPSLTIFRG